MNNPNKAYYLSLRPLVPWLQVERPIDWDRQFGRRAPLEVEIGYGNGEFLVRKARAHPQRNFIGLELTWESTKRALRRIARLEIENVRLLMAEARLSFERLFRPRSLARVYSLFPTPWPKERHAGRRLFSADFLRLLGSRLADGAEVQIVTDFQPLAEWVLEQVPGTGFEARWEITPARFQTKYERKWQESGQDSFLEIILYKREHIDVSLTEDTPLVTFHFKDFDPRSFRPAGQQGPVTVVFKDFVYDPERRKGMVRTLVAEDGLVQHIWIEIADQGEEWRLCLAHESNVLPTLGVRQALELAHEEANRSGGRDERSR